MIFGDLPQSTLSHDVGAAVADGHETEGEWGVRVFKWRAKDCGVCVNDRLDEIRQTQVGEV